MTIAVVAELGFVANSSPGIGNWLIIAGACTALVLAMAMADQFWIANAIFLGGLAGALVGSVTKIAAYHGPFQTW